MRTLLLLALVGCGDEDGVEDKDTDTTSLTDTDPTPAEDESDPPADSDSDPSPPEPDPVAVTLTPAAPIAGEALACAADTTTEVAWSWTRDGLDAGVFGAAVPESTTRAYEVWSCTGTSVDGLLRGRAQVEVDEACRSFAADGVDDLLFVGDSPLLRPTDQTFTLELWVWRERTGVDEDLVNHVAALNRDRIDFSLAFTAADELVFLTASTADDDCARLAVEAPAAEGWHHIAASWEAGTGAKRLFIDGEPVDQCLTQDRPSGAVNGPLELGGAVVVALPPAPSGPARLFRGNLDEVRLSTVERYRVAFSPTHWHQPDADTLLLLHLNALEPRAGGRWRTLDDSGNDLHASLPDAADGTWPAGRSACDVR